MKKQEAKKIRCAIYTRKSTEEGLEQDFNSLDAQRESGEAYIKSQQSEGWICLPEYYDDGGFTGGNMERPALARLLADIEMGKIDCVVVYKVDRLSRSLMDFARILEQFDKKNVSFVSVTQQFNTSTSMGRLTLNVLLSFAQFEREVISERTRDKVAMARKRGKFTGGTLPLGFDVAEGSKLIINKAEAEQVQTIFDLYIKLGSTLAVINELDRRMWKTKTWVTKKGVVHEGRAFNKNTVISLLTNPIYIGKVRFKNKIYSGEHEPIIAEDIFQQVEQMIAGNRRKPKVPNQKQFTGILSGLLRCKACGCGMSHSHTKKKNKRYRYYICQNAQVRGWDKCPHPSLPADEIEKFVVNEIRSIGFDDKLVEEVVLQAQQHYRNELSNHKRRLKLLKHDFEGLQGKIEKLKLLPESDSSISAFRNQAELTKNDIAEASTRIEQLKSEKMTSSTIRKACRKFDPLWDTLSTHEQMRVLNLLLTEVEYEAKTEQIHISFNDEGVNSLANELKGMSA